jgi:hypothetical protein
MAAITFYGIGGGGSTLTDLGGSGIGFYGDAGFGASVKVNEFQGTTYITNSVGTANGGALNNNRAVPLSSSNVINNNRGTGTIPLLYLYNEEATCKIRFSHSSAVEVDNVVVRIFDRSNIDNPPSGVRCFLAEIIKPSGASGVSATSSGKGDSGWIEIYGSAVTLSLTPNPGMGGFGSWSNPINGGTGDTIHDWFLAMSATPTSIGSKDKFGLYASLEYM